jgi:serine protease Do
MKNQVKTFLLGLSFSAIFIISFFVGALADRLFVFKPVDYLVNTSFLTGLINTQLKSQTNNQRNQLLGDFSNQSSLLSQIEDLNTEFGVADVAESAGESVVTVSAKAEQPVYDPYSSFFGFYPFGFENLRPPEPELIQKDIGTGFVVSGGLIVTNRHVVDDPSFDYLIIDKNDVEYEVVEIYKDPEADLAILKAKDMNQLSALELGDSDQLRVGQGVIAIGTALGEFRHTVTTGVVSGLGRGIQATDGRSIESMQGVIQTDAAINPGNSGGPLLDGSGKVIGVNVATSVRAENIGFAIPINIVKASIDNFNNTGQFERPFMGVRYQMISEQSALLNEVPQGAYIIEVLPNSSASEADLRVEDILIEFDGVKLKDQSLASLINSKKVGDVVEVVYWRDSKQETKTLTLRTNP